MVTGGLMAVALAIAIGGPAVAGAPMLRVDPPIVKVIAGAEFTVRVIQDAPGPVSGAQASVTFDDTILQVESVTPGAAYAQAPIVLPQDLASAVASANQAGRLAQVAAAFLPPASVSSGPAVFLVVKFRAVGCGTTALELPVGPRDAAMIDGSQEAYGVSIDVTAVGGQVTTCVRALEATPALDEPAVDADRQQGGPQVLLGGAAGLLIVAVVGLAWRSRRQRSAR
jgi:hypothetical protein